MTATDPSQPRAKVRLTRQAIAGLTAVLVVGLVVSAEPRASACVGSGPRSMVVGMEELVRASLPTRPTPTLRAHGRVRMKPSIGSPGLARHDRSTSTWVVEGDALVTARAPLPIDRLDLPPPTRG
jgi:hypothetical protein